MGHPLEGVRVLDLSQFQAGPSCTQLLAWLGAEVIKIEQPGVGDPTRAGVPAFRTTEESLRPGLDSFFYLVFNSNKRSLCLDLKSEEGVSIFMKLAGISDVVVENFAPGRMERFGLGYERLREVNPRLVFASIKGFGTSGPYSGFKVFEHIAQAMSGSMSANGEAGGPPLITASAVGDSGTGLHCAIGILAALHQRERTGEGDYVEVSMQDAAVSLMRMRMIETLTTGEPVVRSGNHGWGGGPALAYPCHPGGPDDYVGVSIVSGEAWDSLLAVIGRADLIGDDRFTSVEGRAERAGEVEAMITAWTSSRTKYEVMEALNGIGLPCGAVLDTAEILKDPHLRARGMVVDSNDEHRDEYAVLGCPIKVGSGTAPIAPPPLLGQHSGEVLSRLLGIDGEDLDRLARSGVI